MMTTDAETIEYAESVPIDRNSTSASKSKNSTIMPFKIVNKMTAFRGI